jgi:ClpP class serine protease
MTTNQDRTPRAFALEEVMLLDPRAIGRAYTPFGDDEEDCDDGVDIQDGVAVVSIDGPLSQRGGWWWDGYESIEYRVQRALASSATSVLLKINSPGGVVAGCFEAAKRMREACVAAGKPVVAYVDEQACSAAYALACVADSIVLPPSGLVGSVGVIATACDRTKMNAINGVNVHVVASGEHKADLHPDVPLSESALQSLGDRVNMLAGLFADWVALRRGTTSAVVAAQQAAVFGGTDALAARLADHVGALPFALTLARTSAAARTASTPMSGGGTPAPRGNKMNPELLALLGLSATATEQELMAAARDARTASVQLCAITGQSNVNNALGTLVAWKAEAAQVPTLKTQLAEKTAADQARERRELLDAACSGERPVMSPAERREYDTNAALTALPIEAIRASIEARRASGAVVVKTAPTASTGSPSARPTAEELHIAALLNLDPQKIAAVPSVVGMDE